MAIQYAKIAGGRVIAVDLFDEKLELARELGAEFAVNAAAGRSSSSRFRRTTR
jgi:propanol-preferring alcohol dehydrogenase